MRKTLVVHKSKLDVMPKIKGERATKSLKTYAKSTWLVIRRQRRIDTKRRYKSMLQTSFQIYQSLKSLKTRLTVRATTTTKTKLFRLLTPPLSKSLQLYPPRQHLLQHDPLLVVGGIQGSSSHSTREISLQWKRRKSVGNNVRQRRIELALAGRRQQRL